MREQQKSEEKLDEMEIGNLYGKEFRVMIIKMIQDLRKRRNAQIEKIEEMINKEKVLKAASEKQKNNIK